MSTTDPPRQSSVATDLDADATNDDLVEAVNKLVEENQRLRDRVDDLEEQIDETETKVESVANNASGAHARLNEVEADIEGPDPHPSDGENTGPETTIEPETPLESVTVLPEPMAEAELTANQQRARFVAKDIESYSSRVPAGRAIRSSEIGTVLRAGTDCEGRSQTVSRVIRFLEELGGDGDEIVERRGERRVVFAEELVARLQRLTSRPDTSNAVVAEGGV